MAKGKHAAALFEVISKSRGLRNQNEQKVLETPRWWFKRQKNPNRPLVSASAPTRPAPPIVQPAAVIDPETIEAPVPVEHAVASPTASSNGASHSAARPVAIAVDQERRAISLRLSFTSAFIGVLGLLAVVGIAVLVGQHMSGHTNPVLGGPRTGDLMAGPKDPSVLDVQSQHLPITNVEPAGDFVMERPTPPQTGARPAMNSPEVPATATISTPMRVLGMNYLIVQSYPNKKDADDACDCLNQHGVPCTVEKSLKRWNDWYAVVTLKGFSRISNSPEYDQLKAQVMEVSANFAGKKKFRAFDPAPYRWMDPR